MPLAPKLADVGILIPLTHCTTTNGRFKGGVWGLQDPPPPPVEYIFL